MKEKWAETASQNIFAERINNPNDSYIILCTSDYQWYRKDFNYIISYCPQTFPGRFYYMYFTHVEIRDHKLNVGREPLNFDLPDFLNMFVSSVLQCRYIWISRNFTLKKITCGQNNRKKIKEFYGADMGHQQDHWDPTECSDECKTTAKLPG